MHFDGGILIQTKFENHIEWDHVVREFTCID